MSNETLKSHVFELSDLCQDLAYRISRDMMRQNPETGPTEFSDKSLLASLASLEAASAALQRACDGLKRKD